MDDIEYDLMSYCIKLKGKWWANHWFRNMDVNTLYGTLRILSFSIVWDILTLKPEFHELGVFINSRLAKQQ